MLSLVYTQENFPWTDNFSLSCELPCATNGFKTKEIFLSEENFPVCKRALTLTVYYFIETPSRSSTMQGMPQNPNHKIELIQGQLEVL